MFITIMFIIIITFQDGERAPSPDPIVVLSAQENLGPSEEADAEFAKELAKMVTDSSTESRKVDKKTALALWDSAVLPPGARKKRVDDSETEGDLDPSTVETRNMMNFTVITKRGNKQQVRLFYVTSAPLLIVRARIGTSTRRSCSISPRCPHTFRSTPRQSRATAFKKTCVEL